MACAALLRCAPDGTKVLAFYDSVTGSPTAGFLTTADANGDAIPYAGDLTLLGECPDADSIASLAPTAPADGTLTFDPGDGSDPIVIELCDLLQGLEASDAGTELPAAARVLGDDCIWYDLPAGSTDTFSTYELDETTNILTVTEPDGTTTYPVCLNKTVTYSEGDTLTYDVTLPDGTTLAAGDPVPPGVSFVNEENPDGTLASSVCVPANPVDSITCSQGGIDYTSKDGSVVSSNSTLAQAQSPTIGLFPDLIDSAYPEGPITQTEVTASGVMPKCGGRALAIFGIDLDDDFTGQFDVAADFSSNGGATWTRSTFHGASLQSTFGQGVDTASTEDRNETPFKRQLQITLPAGAFTIAARAELFRNNITDGAATIGGGRLSVHYTEERCC